MMDPPSAELLEARHFLVVAAAVIILPAIAGGIAASLWARSQRRRAPAERHGPLLLLRLLERLEGGSLEGSPAPSFGWRGALVLVLVLLYFGNLAVFFAFSTWIGGDASAGHVTAGRFFVSSHGHLTEVSRTVFCVSLWQARSVWLTSVLFFGLAARSAFVELGGKRR